MPRKEEILKRLDFRSFYQEHIPTLKINNGKAQVLVLCPFHEDNKPSLSVNMNSGYFNCFSCGAKGDLFSFYQQIKGVDFKTTLHDLGILTGINQQAKQRVVATFTYKGADGKSFYRKERLEPGRNGQNKEFRFMHNKNGSWVYGRGGDPVLYRLPDVVKSEHVFIVEGEAKADLLARWGLAATTLDSGACSLWRNDYLQYFENRSVCILPDNDKPGKEYASRLAGSLYGKTKILKVVKLPGLSEKEDIIDWVKKEGNTKEILLKIVEQAAIWIPPVATAEEWDTPVLFGNIETPEIPASLLPGWAGEFAKEIARATETPEAMSAFITLGVISAAVSKRFVVFPKPDWNEPVNIYVLVALPPANNKSKVLSECTKPLIEWEQEQARTLEPEIKRITSERKTLEGRIELLRKQAIKESDDIERQVLQKEIVDLESTLPEIPALPRLFANDITPESLTTQLHEQAGRFAIIGDEGGIFEVISGLYSGGNANIDIVLKGIDGGYARVNRREKSCDLKPYLTFAMAVQPVIIENMNRKRAFFGNGMLERFLYLVPKSRLGYRTHDTTPVPNIVKATYNEKIKSLLNIAPQLNEFKEEIPRILTLEQKAYREWRDFQNYIETQLRPDGRLYPLLGWGGKLCGYALRLAGLLHIAEHGEGSCTISFSTMCNALEMSALLIDHAMAAFSLSGKDKATEDAKIIFEWIKRRSELSFKQRDCHNKFQRRFPTINDLKKTLDLLAERKIISQVQNLRTGGRVSTFYKVNPTVFNISNRQF